MPAVNDATVNGNLMYLNGAFFKKKKKIKKERERILAPHRQSFHKPKKIKQSNVDILHADQQICLPSLESMMTSMLLLLALPSLLQCRWIPYH